VAAQSLGFNWVMTLPRLEITGEGVAFDTSIVTAGLSHVLQVVMDTASSLLRTTSPASAGFLFNRSKRMTHEILFPADQNVTLNGKTVAIKPVRFSWILSDSAKAAAGMPSRWQAVSHRAAYMCTPANPAVLLDILGYPYQPEPLGLSQATARSGKRFN